MRWTMRLIMILAALLVNAACDEDHSTTGPDGGEQETTVLAGEFIRYPSMNGQIPVQIHITGADVDTFMTTDRRYELLVASGNTYTVSLTVEEPYDSDYTITPSSRTVAAATDTVTVTPFLLLSQADFETYEENSLGFVYGRVVWNDQIHADCSVALATPDGEIIRTVLCQDVFFFLDIPQGTYRITPLLDLYEFDPPDRTITLDDIFVATCFSVTYAGPERHTISCRILSDVQIDNGIMMARTADLSETYVGMMDENGYATTRLLMPGTYIVSVSCSTTGGRIIGSQQFTVELTDHDIDLGELMFHYTGPMYFEVSGAVTDTAGNGIEGVTVRLDGFPGWLPPNVNFATTDGQGVYVIAHRDFSTRQDIDYTVTASKPGWSFAPPSFNLVQEYVELLPFVSLFADFTGTPLTIGPYFPFAPGASWTYAHTADGVPSGTLTAEAGASFTAGGETWVPLSGYMFDSFAGYRVDNATLYAWTVQRSETWATLDESSWDMGSINGYSATGERLEPEDVTVPAGTFADCMVIRITIPPDSPSAEVTTYWLAEGVGPVKVEFTATSGGTVVQRITDELTAYQEP